MSNMGTREDQLPYGIDVALEDSTTGVWWLVYDQAEGFQPLTYAIRADDECSAEEVWEEQERNLDSRGDLVIIPLRRNIPRRNFDTGRWETQMGSLEEE